MKRTLILACGAMLFAGACSSSSGVGVGPAPLVEKSYAISTGDAVCKAMRDDVNQQASQYRSAHPSPSIEEAHDFMLNTILARVDHGVGDMHRIGQPTKDRAAFDTAVKDLDADLASLKRAVGADPIKVLTTSPIKLFDTSAKAFADYGFKECGKN